MKKAILILFTLIFGIGQSFAERVTDRSWYDNVQGTNYTISTFGQLCALADIVNSGEDDFTGKTIEMTEYIGGLQYVWIPIGTTDHPFNGTFDGKGFQIGSFSIHLPNEDEVGLFGCIGKKGKVANLKIEVSQSGISGNNNVGILAGVSYGIITNCEVYGGPFIVANTGGGLVGYQPEGLISNCYALSNPTGEGASLSLGVLVGISGGTVFQCYSRGSISGKLTDNKNGSCCIGGLIGQAVKNSKVEECFAKTDITADGLKLTIGGLIGYQVDDILNCYSIGNIETAGSIMNIGGLIGNHHSGDLTNCYSAITTNIGNKGTGENNNIGGFVGFFSSPEGSINSCYMDNTLATNYPIGNDHSNSDVTNIPTFAMYQANTFVGWDFTEIWDIDEGNSYPTLQMIPKEDPEPPVTDPEWWDDSWYKDMSSPYIIKTEEQLATFAKLVSDGEDDFTGKSITLANDLRLAAFISQYTDDFIPGGWKPIGNADNPFNGTFDGNENTIHELGMYFPDEENIGLFGVIGENGTIKKLQIQDCADFRGKTNVGIIAGASYGDISDCGVHSENSFFTTEVGGGLVGHQYEGTISGSYAEIKSMRGEGNKLTMGGLVGIAKGKIHNCNSNVDIYTNANEGIWPSSTVGGLVGISYSTITYSYALGKVRGFAIGSTAITGGFVGMHTGGSIEECYAAVYTESTALSAYAGGFAGNQALPIKNCFATGKVFAEGQDLHVGGFVGDYHSGPLVNCYSTGNIGSSGGNKNNYVGGFLGYVYHWGIEGCYYDEEKSGMANGIGYNSTTKPAEVNAQSTVEMSQKTTYKNWDFYGIWKMDQTSGYPILRMGDTETPPNPQPEPETYTITLNIATYINATKETGSYIINEGDGFSLTFHLENSEGYTDSDILFLLDGEEIDINSFQSGTNYRFTLNNIEADHTIDIALKTYKITVPQIEGLLTDPEAGTYNIPYGEPFTIIFTLEDKYDQSVVVVLINGKVVDLSALKSTSFTYTIDKVVEPIVIEIKGIELNDPTHNMNINQQSLNIYTSEGILYINTNHLLPIEIYSISGTLLTSQKVNGETQVNLPQGIYVIKCLSASSKVIIK